MSAMQQFGQFVRKRREDMGLTSRALAMQLDMDPATLSRIETGVVKTLPEPEVLQRVASALAVTMPDVLQAAGYLSAEDRSHATVNPFTADDPRWALVECVKRFDLTREQAESVSKIVTLMGTTSHTE